MKDESRAAAKWEDQEQQQLQRELLGAFQGDDGSMYDRHPPGGGSAGGGNLKMAGGLVAGGAIVGLLGLQFPFLFPKSAPYMATPGIKIRRALQFLKDNHDHHHPHSTAIVQNTTSPPRYGNIKAAWKDIRPDATATVVTSPHPGLSSSRPPTFVDLGSGDGQAVYEAARLGYRAIGIEFNWALWAFSSLRRLFFWSKDERDRSTLVRQDFTHYDLREADTVMIFAVPRTMPVLGRKIQAECRGGTAVLAYRFPIPLAQQDDARGKDAGSGRGGNDDDGMLLNADLVYDHEDMRIYRMKDKEHAL